MEVQHIIMMEIKEKLLACHDYLGTIGKTTKRRPDGTFQAERKEVDRRYGYMEHKKIRRVIAVNEIR